MIYVNDIDASLLSAKPCLDPYTPESIDSHTPNAEANSRCSDDLGEVADVLSNLDDPKSVVKLKRDRSVSPTQLKTRLDMLLNRDKQLSRLNSRESCRSGKSSKGLCCLALKCYGFCRRRARDVACTKCRGGVSDCCE